MNKQEADIMNVLFDKPYINQRILSELSGYSLGVVNRSIKELTHEGLLDNQIRPTKSAYELLKEKSPKNAIILAAGLGMRMVPISTHVPKALLEVNGEPLIERLIRQLNEVGIHEIHVVVGFMKEQLEYLIDDYNVNLIVNEEYSSKNNLHSLALAAQYISNTYVIPCDICCEINPFRSNELYSWYMVSDAVDSESTVRVNRKMELVTSVGGNGMIGIAYLEGVEASKVRERLMLYDSLKKYSNCFWEEVLIDGDRMSIPARIVHSADAVEINTYEQLREIDEESNQLKADAIEVICQALNADKNEIVDIKVLKKGMTNRSFIFTCKGKRYIMRIPGEGTDYLINRSNESAVYDVVKDKGICDDVVYINPQNGYKITRFIENSRTCDSLSPEDVRICMEKLKRLHGLKLTVGHDFDIFGQIEFYESLWKGEPSIYKDYEVTKRHVFELKSFIEANVTERCLTHIDAVPDNFLFTEDGEVLLIDWEYAGMQDPHVDIAMFCIYGLYDRRRVDNLIDIYFDGNCNDDTRLKIYCYIAVCGLLWSNWCEYKRSLGIEFGEYSLRQYRYAKDYYRLFMEVGGKDES